MPADPGPPPFTPFVPADRSPPELTFVPVALGALLGVVFGAASVYLVLKVGLTVSASIPVAVLAITLLKAVGQTSILQNNIVQTTGSAGESIAFGVGLVMPALLTLGFDIDAVRVMTVGVLGGLLGILMMIPLRRAFIVNKHGELKYPEGTACADVLIAGEKGGATARTLFAGFGLGFVFDFVAKGLNAWNAEPSVALSATNAAGKAVGLKAGVLGCEMSAPLLGVGYIIGPRIASIMVAGGVLAYLVLTPLIASVAPPPAAAPGAEAAEHLSAGDIRSKYILYIGAGAVAAGGILSMLQALPVIFGSVAAGFRDLLSNQGAAAAGRATPRTERDLPIITVVAGSVGMVLALAAIPAMGLGFSLVGIFGAVMVLLFGFLFVTVSSRLTGEIGSSSNPISGMTIATLLLTCLFILGLDYAGVLTIGKDTKLLALTIAGVVCVACSNGGTTSQALKTGHLLGATPRAQQVAILIGSLTSALVVGVVLIVINLAGTVYSKKDLPAATVDVSRLAGTGKVQTGPYSTDPATYHVLVIGLRETPDPTLFVGDPGTVPPGRYLIDDAGKFAYLCDPAVNGKLKLNDDGSPAGRKFDAPKTQLIALIIDGVLDQNLPWDLVLIGVLIAVTLELSGVPALPFAVGVYLPISASVPIFLGGVVRLVVDRARRSGADDGDASPGVLLSSGYIAGGSIAALLATVPQFMGQRAVDSMDVGAGLKDVPWLTLGGTPWMESGRPVTLAFGALAAVLFVVGARKR